MRHYFTTALILVIMTSYTTCLDRDVPITFPAKDGFDPTSKEKIDKLLDANIPGGFCFTNVSVNDLIGWFTQIGPGVIISRTTSVENYNAILPTTPDTVVICMPKATYREALNELCSVSHLSWQLEPIGPYEIGKLVRIRICRPEIFLFEKQNESWLDDWYPILPLIGIGLLLLVPILFFSIFPLLVKEDLATELIGKKYYYLLNPSTKDYFKNQVVGTFIDRFIPIPSDLIYASLLKKYIKSDHRLAVEYAYRILKKKGNRVPKEAWKEFFKRNPEAKNIESH